MKKYQHIFMVLLVVASSCRARNDQEQFLRANKYCEKGQWDKALDAYNTIEKKGSGVWYNMGNCLYSLQKCPDALVCFKRAQNGASSSKELRDIAGNIDAVYAKIGKAKDATWLEYLYHLFKQAVVRFSLLFFQLLFLSSWYLLWFCIKRSRRKKRWILIASFLSIVIVWSGISLFVEYQEQKYPTGITMKDSVSIFAGPNKEYHVLAKAQCADEVKILHVQTDWFKVRYHGIMGWMAADNVKKV